MDCDLEVQAKATLPFPQFLGVMVFYQSNRKEARPATHPSLSPFRPPFPHLPSSSVKEPHLPRVLQEDLAPVQALWVYKY